LEKIGFLCERVKAVHCVHLNHRDIEILKRRGVKVAHCPESNMKLASGQAPVVELLDEGVVVGLGTDGAASNNNLNLFEEMDVVAKFHKAAHNDPTVVDAKTVLKMVTSEAAKVVFKEKEIGSLEVGKTADLIILNLNLPHLVPLYNVYSHLVYSAGGAEVETVIINGKLIMEEKNILTIDEAEVMDQARFLAKKIQAEVGHV
jgi:5-methylthioadenosine/S-adenosylhomocysteine deaminase